MRFPARAVLAFSLLLAGVVLLPFPAPAQQSETPQETVYIPQDLDDCFVQLEKLLSPQDLATLRDRSEDDMIRYHFGLGMWMRNNWGLWGGSRLAGWFNERGIFHPDDMSGIILDSFWRHLNDRPIELEAQIKRYQDYWAKQGQPAQ